MRVKRHLSYWMLLEDRIVRLGLLILALFTANTYASDERVNSIINDSDRGWKEMDEVLIDGEPAPYCSGDYLVNVEPLPVSDTSKISADSIKSRGKGEVFLAGDSLLNYKGSYVNARDIAISTSASNTYTISASRAYVVDNDIFLFANSMKIEDSKNYHIYGGGYGSVPSNRLRFDFSQLNYDSVGKYADAKDISFTTCEPGDAEWHFTGDSINIDMENNIGEAFDATFYAGDTPVLWLPYESFPVNSGGGKSGFLPPSISIGGLDGLEVVTPFYWYIAPNLDYTIYPHFSLKRSVLLENEVRWLNEFGMNSLNFGYNPGEVGENESKYMLNINHDALYPLNFYTKVEYYNTSDADYFENYYSLLSNVPNRSVPQTNKASVGWYNDYVKTDVSVVSYNVYDTKPMYSQLPNFNITLFNNSLEDFSFGGYSSLVYFDSTSDDTTVKSSTRANLNVFAEYSPLPFVSIGAAGDIILYNVEEVNADDYEDNYSYFIPTTYAKFGGNLFTSASSDSVYIFRPKVNFLYTPYIEQKNPLFDTNYRMFSYDNLDSISSVNGYDRVQDTMQVSAMLENIFYFGEKRLDINFAQVFYLKDSQMTMDTIPIEKQERLNKKNFSPFIVRLNFHESEDGILSIEEHFDLETAKQSYFSTFYNYQPSSRSLYHIGYTWIDNEFYENSYTDVESFIRLAMSQSITDMWSMETSIEYDFIDNRTRNVSLLFGRTSCCGEVKFGVQGSNRYSEDDPLSFLITFNLLGITSAPELNSSIRSIAVTE